MSAAPPAIPDLDTADAEELRIYQIKSSIYTQLSTRLQVLWNWVYTTVDPQLLELATLRASDQSLYALIKELKKDLCPSDDDWKEQVRTTYRGVTLRPLSGVSQAPESWLLDWTRAHANAQLVDLEEIKGTLPIKDFLRSATKYHPEWAQRELESLARPNTPNTLTLGQYATWLSQLVQDKESSLGVYATFAGRSSNRNTCPCPCRPNIQHSWKPGDCGRLEYALTGRTDRELRSTPTEAEVTQIKERLESAQYNNLREALVKKGWISKVNNGTSQYPGSISA